MLLDTRIRNLILEEEGVRGHFFFSLFGLIILRPQPNPSHHWEAARPTPS